MSIVMQNPPLCSYYIAAIAIVSGWSERSLHLAFLVWAVLSVLGTFAIAWRFWPRASLCNFADTFHTSVSGFRDECHVRRDDARVLGLGAGILAGGFGSTTIMALSRFGITHLRGGIN